MDKTDDLFGKDIEKIEENSYLDEDGKIDIFKFFGREKLETIQRNLSKATGLAFVTVDFRGEPITESTLFTKFCTEVRKSETAKERCKSSDAFGSIQAAVTKKTSVYFCPCGLLEVAIPIIVKGQYLGGFIGGQVRCYDAPETINSLKTVVRNAEAEEFTIKCNTYLEEIPVKSFEQFENVASLVSMVINELCENALAQYKNEEVYRKYIKKLEHSNLKNTQLLKEKEMQIEELKLLTNPYVMLEMLNSVLNLTIVEDATQSADVLETFIEFYKYTYTDKDKFVNILNELEYINNYLILQQKKYGEKIEFSIEVPIELHMKKIPSKILLPFIKSAVHNSVLLKKTGGKIVINASVVNKNMVFEIFNDGVGLSKNEIDAKIGVYKDKHEYHFIKLGMDFAKDKMFSIFGDEYKISIENYKNKGQKCVIYWPEFYDEGAVE